MVRRHPPSDPELAALARERLARVLGADVGPRRAARLADRGSADQRDGEADLGRGDPGPRPVVPGDLEPARRFTRWHLAVVAVVLLVGLVWGGWSWVRARPVAVAAPPVLQTALPSGSTVPSPTGSPSPPGPGVDPPAGPVVHVLGAVRHPGLVRLRPGARAQDAIEAAGGLRRDADPDELNLAEPLDDGVQVVVGTRSHPAGEVRPPGAGTGGTEPGGGSPSSRGSSRGSPSGSSAGPGRVVDLNRATVDQLDTLPGVGPVTAQKIVDWRAQHGRFSRAEELQEVDGIGPKTYARMAPHVRV